VEVAHCNWEIDEIAVSYDGIRKTKDRAQAVGAEMGPGSPDAVKLPGPRKLE
jgi:hypothetical protein